jgi:threonine dehydratase
VDPTSREVTRADIESARDLLGDVARRTPVEGSRPLSERVGGPVALKCENLQRAGSFKIRGAYVRIARLTDDERGHGVVAASAGNHAQGVALAATLLGTSSTVFMPEGAPIPKVEATKAYGATVRFAGATVDEALVAAEDYAAQSGAVVIHPFDHPDIVAGQGTVGLEILEQCPEVKTVVVGVGGGGLVSGVAAAIKPMRPDVVVVGVQAAGAASYPPSLAAGSPQKLASMATIADGIAVGCPGELTFRMVRHYVDDIVTVSEEALSQALLLCLERAKLLVEPAGAAAVAALMDSPQQFEPPVVAVLSGGNIDPLMMERVISRGLVASDRYLTLRIGLPDRPGQLAVVSGLIAEVNANVVEVLHTRHGNGMPIGEVQIDISVETRGATHRDQVIARLEASGYSPRVIVV